MAPCLLWRQVFHGDVEVLQESFHDFMLCNEIRTFPTENVWNHLLRCLEEQISELCGRALNRFCGELEGRVVQTWSRKVTLHSCVALYLAWAWASYLNLVNCCLGHAVCRNHGWWTASSERESDRSRFCPIIARQGWGKEVEQSQKKHLSLSACFQLQNNCNSFWGLPDMHVIQKTRDPILHVSPSLNYNPFRGRKTTWCGSQNLTVLRLVKLLAVCSFSGDFAHFAVVWPLLSGFWLSLFGPRISGALGDAPGAGCFEPVGLTLEVLVIHCNLHNSILCILLSALHRRFAGGAWKWSWKVREGWHMT